MNVEKIAGNVIKKQQIMESSTEFLGPTKASDIDDKNRDVYNSNGECKDYVENRTRSVF